MSLHLEISTFTETHGLEGCGFGDGLGGGFERLERMVFGGYSLEVFLGN